MGSGFELGLGSALDLGLDVVLQVLFPTPRAGGWSACLTAEVLESREKGGDGVGGGFGFGVFGADPGGAGRGHGV